MFFEQLLISLPFLSLAIVLSALSMMAPQHDLAWLWRTAGVAASLAPVTVVLEILTPRWSLDGMMLGALVLSLLGSAPLAAAMSLTVAIRLRRAA
ncbi:MAG: hypothetical protein INF48_03425 [Rhodobacter sp.]|nr:hypothetical protein [Rhodobacter sp.]